MREALESLIEPTVQERAGNYDLAPGVEESGCVFFYENWDSADDLDAHLAARTSRSSRPPRRPARRQWRLSSSGAAHRMRYPHCSGPPAAEVEKCLTLRLLVAVDVSALMVTS